ncbi:MAG: DUF1015 domain-containing protein [bacterium]
MPVIKPFKAFRYNETYAHDMAKLICPPYDIITPACQEKLLKQNPLNIVRVELPKALDNENPYQQAAAVFNQWILDGVLIQDTKPSLYVYEQQFKVQGKSYRRRGIFAAVKIEKPREGLILPHENTLSKHKEDRLKLLKTVKANISPIFGFFSDSKGPVRNIIAQSAKRKSLYKECKESGVIHRLFVLSDPEKISVITNSIKEKKVFIADGHHRYETAWNYLMYVQGLGQRTEAAAHVLMFLCPLEDKGLIVLPTHRVVKKSDYINIDAIKTQAQNDFSIEHVSSLKHLRLMMNKSKSRNIIGLSSGKVNLLLTPINFKKIDTMHTNASLDYRRLGVTVLHSLILSDIDPHDISFVKNISDACKQAQSGKHVAFLLKAPTLDDIRNISLSGETMPQKTTYFYPKLATGFVIHGVKT